MLGACIRVVAFVSVLAGVVACGPPEERYELSGRVDPSHQQGARCDGDVSADRELGLPAARGEV